MCAKQVTKKPGEQVGTTGHSWDGIEELNNPLPRWWVWVFYATIVWGIGYTVAYPAWPLISGATPGVLGASTRADVAAEIERFDAANADIKAQLVAAPLASIPSDQALMAFAEPAGGAVFKTYCAQCHGSGAAGVEGKGYPSLLDDDWLWGGTIEDIHLTITHGIRNTTDADARYSEMPKFGADGLLDDAQIGAVVEHVLAISGQEHDAALATEGATLFADNCAACHGDAGTGDRTQGAPNLTDAIWLYGGSREKVKESVAYARFGVMPAWAGRLTEDEIRAVAAYVHSRGGGE
ncbi:cytochrome-c oxidase, cbb3-type subunit III [Rhodobacteraceae bacterium HSP-20]|uniref:Cbb3-type cytochrome c oxidase subunit n=1 Tax=Paragemmobacter amnigenus TaxID=2852097 RepID=A0ABS6J4J2_9RHOB|nr:cytochrome-c oxidase, cbb3-type subunit III [Rhodobacter amnigenus]MBU9697377.1 cytochrome-c oxidase, cbb3-type subunit III [Rhodobacter amnigenus]MBV4388604.1 cytochrome-c oxidase, cbb3-type subunit III [Rhodobacter amnigenus]